MARKIILKRNGPKDRIRDDDDDDADEYDDADDYDYHDDFLGNKSSRNRLK